MKKRLLCSLLLISLATHTLKAAESFEVTVTGTGSPIIFIPGLACDGSVWDETISRYSATHECHVLTLAGFGHSQLPPITEQPFLPTVEDELVKYVRENELSNPIAVGHSLGGFVLLQVAATQPELFSQLLIVDSLPFLPAATNPSATVETIKPLAESQRRAMSNTPQEPDTSRRMLQMMISNPTDIESAIEMTTHSHPAAVAQAMFEMNTTDARENVSNIKTPTLVLGAWIAYQQFGATKESTASIFNSQYAKLPNYQLELSDHGKHFIMWDDPDFFFAQLDRVLNR